MNYIYHCWATTVLITVVLSLDVDKQAPSNNLPLKLGSECSRECNDDTSYHCIFNWKVIKYDIDYDICIQDPTTCFGDGIVRQTTVITEQNETPVSIPAPPLQVCYGDVVTVNLFNGMDTYDTTIHWHGLHMKEGIEGATQWADGVPYVTQCPVSPHVTYNWYTFNAMPAGTFWFHSHNEFQRDDGAYGALIVREQAQQKSSWPNAVQNVLSDTCDDVNHYIIIQEWYHETAEYRFKTDPNIPPTSILVNGKGRSDFDSTMIPWQTFKVDPRNDGCTRYRFRLISSANLQCPIEVSIENHNLTVIATDGDYIEPMENIATIGINNAERYDFIIDTTGMEYKTYTIRFGGAPGAEANCRGLSAIAFLQYGESVIDQSKKPNIEDALNAPGNIINPLPNIILPDFQKRIPVTELRSIYSLSNTEKADKTFYLQFGDGERGAHINNIQFNINKLGVPLLSQENEVDQNMICDSSYALDAVLCDPFTEKHGCDCFHILDIDVGDVVEIFILNPLIDKEIVHPIHLHGYWHNVIGSGVFPPHTESFLEYVKRENDDGNIERNLKNPPRKDSLQSITGGYILIRFLADNPGFWIMHCHISFDQIEGQNMVFKVGNSSDWTIPENFPKC